ncbi:MAG: hypothetical protein LBP60_03430 [Spirochaetaceae bacterium]|jgi:hypothetical protein|nr:hypothetical protein [Spirochaetaceae bacterium]
MKRKKELLKTAAGAVCFVLVCMLLPAGCGMSTDDLAAQVQASILETLNEQGIDAEIESFTLVKKSKTEYRGILKASLDGETESVAVNVTVDGDSFMWEFDN